MKFQKYGCLNRTGTGKIPVAMLTWKGKISQDPKVRKNTTDS